MELISVVIPSYNRFKYLLNTIESIKCQTYTNLEIIVVNDCSTEKEYYEYDWVGNQIKIISLELNSRAIFGYPCAGYVRNKGIYASTGSYIAFCDDDDIWFPKKLELQYNAMKDTGCLMSSTDGLIGKGIYNTTKTYKKFNAESCYKYIAYQFYKKRSKLFRQGFPKIWTLEFLKINNSVICSSVVVKKEILDKINNFECLPNGQEDYNCWLRVLANTNSVYIPEICFYYDAGHGDGQNY